MNTTSTGKSAESRVSDYLKDQGYKIRDMNWKTRWCEIDIVAEKDKRIYFVEVKYRRTNSWGDGFDAVTRTKLKQMSLSAEFWIHSNRWSGEAELLVASVNDEAISLRAVE